MVALMQLNGILERIKLGNNAENDLKEFHEELLKISKNHLAEKAGNLDLLPIFDCINSSSKSMIEMACECLKIALNSFQPYVILNTYKIQLLRCNAHPEKCAKKVFLEQIIRSVRDPLALEFVCHENDFLDGAIQCLADDEVSVGVLATEFFSSFGLTNSGFKCIINPIITTKILENVHKSETYKLRFNEIMIDICVKCPDRVKEIIDYHLLDNLFTQLKSDDILALLASIKEFTRLAVMPHMFPFIEDVLKHLEIQLTDCKTNPLSSLIYADLLKFFGHIGQVNLGPLLKICPKIIENIIEAVDSDDISISVIAMESIAFIATSTQGKLTLIKHHGDILPEIANKIYNLAVRGPTEYKARALSALANLLHLEANFMKNELSTATEGWFSSLGPDALGYITTTARQPFNEVKIAAFQVLEELAKTKWGQTMFTESRGFLDFLLDRSTETEMEGVQAKYQVVWTLGESATSPGVFGETEFSRIDTFITQGVFYSPTINQVAFEGED